VHYTSPLWNVRITHRPYGTCALHIAPMERVQYTSPLWNVCNTHRPYWMCALHIAPMERVHYTSPLFLLNDLPILFFCDQFSKLCFIKIKNLWKHGICALSFLLSNFRTLRNSYTLEYVTICNIIFKPKTAVVAMAVYLDLHSPVMNNSSTVIYFHWSRGTL
jgi:hypothetical protein